MPTFTDGGREIEINREITMLDTNVLVAAFSPSEGRRHSDALAFIENPSLFGVSQWLVPLVVVTEAWGMLTRGDGRDAGLAMLRWLNDPGNPVVLCRFVTDEHGREPRARFDQVVERHHVDVVDTFLLAIGEDITDQCDLRPPLQIATFDLRDFPRLKRALKARVRIFDMNSLEPEDVLD